MGEQPIFSTKAHVFQIDPDTKKKWLPSSTQAVPVSFYHDGVRGLYRIISVEAAKILINSTLVPAMVFTKTSQKFGQWSDSKASTVYGIGFASEIDLTQFMEKFQEVKELSRDVSPQPGLTDSFTGLHINNGSTERDGRASPLVAKPGSPSPDGVEQLKYENDRLKIALAQSSANAKKWETELATLRSNNARLVSAMNQSEVNVQQWTAQLASYREENARLQKQLSELELSALSGADQVRRDLVETKIKLGEMEQLYSEKHKELFDCESKMKELRQIESQHDNLKSKHQSVEDDNVRLRREVSDLSAQLERAKRGATNKREISAVQEQLSTKINELYVMTDRLADLLHAPTD